jgi:hypothetical protein
MDNILSPSSELKMLCSLKRWHLPTSLYSVKTQENLATVETSNLTNLLLQVITLTRDGMYFVTVYTLVQHLTPWAERYCAVKL